MYDKSSENMTIADYIFYFLIKYLKEWVVTSKGRQQYMMSRLIFNTQY